MNSKNPVNPKKILHSKWTAVNPQSADKHFIVVSCYFSAPNRLDQVELEAVVTKNLYRYHWRVLKDPAVWRMGWH